MINISLPAYSSSLHTEEFEPYIEDGVRLGDVHWIRREFEGDQPTLLVGIMRASADDLQEAFEYEWVFHETIQVIEGRLEVEIIDGPTIVLNPGEIGSFRKGGRAIFRATGPYKQFFIMHQ
jgi:ethanolamine utilization protein EutQ (cupin superfamily)